MAYFHGSKGQVKIGGGTIGQCTAWSYDSSIDTYDATVMGSTTTAKSYGAGLTDGSGTVDFKFDTEHGDVLASMTAGSAVILKLYYNADGATKYFMTGTVLINSWSVSGGVDDVYNGSFGFQGEMTLDSE